MKIFSFVLVASILLSGCATTKPYTDISAIPDEEYSYVDISRVDQAVYRKDYAECAIFANQTPKNNDRVIGNTVNKLLDRATLGILGDSTSKDADQITVLKKCLTGRGYNVLR